jgi:threonine synthase
VSAIACRRCSVGDLDPLAWRCPLCGGPLELVAAPEVEPVALGEPITPLVEWPRDDGVEVLLKLEGTLPTGSFKDRGSALLAGWLARHRARSAVIDSSGNAGASLAAYCARAGIACDVYAPATAAPPKLTQIRAYGARVHLVAGPRQAAADAAVAAAEGGAVYAAHAWSPLFTAGTATCAIELHEQLGGRVPDAVVVPVGAGTLFLGIRRGYADVGAARAPRLFGVQTTACPPLALAHERGEAEPAPVTPRRGAAEGILIARPPRGAEVLAAARETGGAIIAVEDDAVWRALAKLARSGVYVEPTSAAAVAGLELLIDTGRLGSAQRVVVILTGTGLKASAQIAAALFD